MGVHFYLHSAKSILYQCLELHQDLDHKFHAIMEDLSERNVLSETDLSSKDHIYHLPIQYRSSVQTSALQHTQIAFHPVLSVLGESNTKQTVDVDNMLFWTIGGCGWLQE